MDVGGITSVPSCLSTSVGIIVVIFVPEWTWTAVTPLWLSSLALDSPYHGTGRLAKTSLCPFVSSFLQQLFFPLVLLRTSFPFL